MANYKIPMSLRLKCKNSYADVQSPELLCECGGNCDGGLYECCLYDKSMSEQMEIIKQSEIVTTN